jgi:hypothetical protein
MGTIIFCSLLRKDNHGGLPLSKRANAMRKKGRTRRFAPTVTKIINTKIGNYNMGKEIEKVSLAGQGGLF